VEGGADVVLTRPGQRFGPGELPEGDYAIEVRFGGGDAIFGGHATVRRGATTVVRCDAAAQACEASP
jgi:hypothetical protein